MRKYDAQRGSILVESALVVGTIFMMLFGTVFIAIVGFDQMSADGASYEVAHQMSVGAAAPGAAANGVFPNIPQTGISAAIQPAPVASIPVNYGYNSTDATEVSQSANDRHGGVSMMQGTMINGSAQKVSSSILGIPITVVGNMVEPLWLENGLHFNAQNSSAYGSTAPICAPTTVPPGGGTATPGPCFQGNVLTTGENTPPYFVGFDFMSHCVLDLPYDLPAGYGTAQNCPDNNLQITPLGMAEFLDNQNWCNSQSTSGCNIANAGIAGSKPSDSTFALVSCHQRVYAQIANFLANYSSLEALDASAPGGGGSDNVSNASTSPAAVFYYYRLPNASKSNSFKDFAGFDTSCDDEAYCINSQTGQPYTTQTEPGTIDSLVREVYNWDGDDISNNSNSTLNPSVGC